MVVAMLTAFRRLRSGWAQNPVLRSRLASIGHLLSGNVLNAVIMLVGISIAARALGAAEYGVMVLILTFGRVFERLVRFESWQPLIRFAAQEELGSNPPRLAQLYLYGLFLDIGAAFLAALLAVGFGYFLASAVGLSDEHFSLIAIYSVAIALNIRGMPTAALRMSGSFRTIAYCQLITSVVRVGLAFVCLLQGGGLLSFILVWTGSQILGAAIFLWLGFRALEKAGTPSPLTASPRSMRRNFPGFLGFAWSTNLSSTLRMLTQEADTLLVGALAGTSSVGVYHIAKRCAKVALQVGAQVQTVIYPDMARLWANDRIAEFRAITLKVQAALGAIALCLLAGAWLLGDLVIRIALGNDFDATYPLLLAQLVAVGLIMHAAPSRSALLAMNEPRFVLVVALIATTLFFGVAVALTPILGPMGASIAHICFSGFTALMLDFAWLTKSRRSTMAHRD